MNTANRCKNKPLTGRIENDVKIVNMRKYLYFRLFQAGSEGHDTHEVTGSNPVSPNPIKPTESYT